MKYRKDGQLKKTGWPKGKSRTHYKEKFNKAIQMLENLTNNEEDSDKWRMMTTIINSLKESSQ